LLLARGKVLRKLRVREFLIFFEWSD